MGVDDGDTLHGFRSGCAITLALSGIELSEIMDNVGWNRRHTALHYLQLAKVLNPSGASAKLASSEVMSVNSTWQGINELKRFVRAFPSTCSRKRPQSDWLLNLNVCLFTSRTCTWLLYFVSCGRFGETFCKDWGNFLWKWGVIRGLALLRVVCRAYKIRDEQFCFEGAKQYYVHILFRLSMNESVVK